MLTTTNVPDAGRSTTGGVTPATDQSPSLSHGSGPQPSPSGPTIARYSLDDRRRAVADLNTCVGEEQERCFVLGELMEEVRANARGGARSEQTRRVLALADAYEQRRDARLRRYRRPDVLAETTAAVRVVAAACGAA